MYAIHHIGGAMQVAKMPKAKAIEYAKAINAETHDVPEHVELVGFEDARRIMQERLFRRNVFSTHGDVYALSMGELVEAVNQYCA